MRLAGSVTRVSAREIESIVLRALRERYPQQDALDDRTVITGSVDRIVLRDAALDITLLIDTESATDAVDDPDKEGYCSAPAPALTVTWKRLAARRRREIIEFELRGVRPIRAETRATLVRYRPAVLTPSLISDRVPSPFVIGMEPVRRGSPSPMAAERQPARRQSAGARQRMTTATRLSFGVSTTTLLSGETK